MVAWHSCSSRVVASYTQLATIRWANIISPGIIFQRFANVWSNGIFALTAKVSDRDTANVGIELTFSQRRD